MKNNIYVLNQRQDETFDAAGKAMRDVFSVLADKNAKIIWSVPKHCSKYLKLLDLPYLVLFLLFHVNKNDNVFYSIPENHLKIRLLKSLQRVKKYRIICFVNDLNAFRYDGQTDGDPGEVRALAAADKILAPNVNTVSMLKKNGISSDMIPVGIWDYRMNETQIAKIREISHAHKKENEVKIAFAGNLNKSEFLSVMEIPSDVRMELWGKLDPEREKTLADGCYYHGILSSDEIPFAVAEMDYGLVWDGNGKDEIEGGLGEYLRYNNSHKCALYLASGIPVIVWSQSGMAYFVKEHACGIVIDRLSDLDQVLREADYEKVKEAALAVAPKLWEGYYLSKAIDTASSKHRIEATGKADKDM